jgi:ribonuclease J
MSNKLRIIPIGGLGEIGKNMTAFEYGENILIVDTGLMFPENDMLGIDYIIPDFQYIIDRADWVRGIVITHGHEDHTGAINHVLDHVKAPIFATPLTRGLLEVKIARDKRHQNADVITVQAGQTIEIDPFKIELFHVSHSIPDCVGLGITTPAGLVVHTGDYKFDHTPVDGWPTDFGKLAEFSARGVMALLADSTNADDPGWTPSERVIDPAFDEVFRNAPGRIIIASFASLISRMQQVANAAHNHGRKLAFVGRSMTDNAKMAQELGYLEIAAGVEVSTDEALNMKESQVVLMCTGSQGEPTSIMGRLARDTNRLFGVKNGDTIVLSSHPIPGNEEIVYRTINSLFRRGATVIYDPIAPVHVSGHASQEEMKLLLHLVKPKHLIPIHGELRHLHQHAALAREVGIPAENIAVVENGQSIEFENGRMRLGERIPGGYVFVDGSGVGDIGPSVVRERDLLSREGFVMVNLQVNPQTGKLVREPEIVTKGFVYEPESDELILETVRRIAKTVESANGNMQKDVEKQVKNFLYNETKRRPMVFVSVFEA